MKKLILSAALVLGSLTTFASTPVLNSNLVIVSAQDEYKEVTADQLPEAVKTSLTKAYPTATIDKAYVNAATEYKLDITVGDVKSTVYADAKGNWIKK